MLEQEHFLAFLFTIHINSTLDIHYKWQCQHNTSFKKDEYEFYVEAKNFIKDVASSEDVPAGFREQAQRMIARMVMVKL